MVESFKEGMLHMCKTSSSVLLTEKDADISRRGRVSLSFHPQELSLRMLPCTSIWSLVKSQLCSSTRQWNWSAQDCPACLILRTQRNGPTLCLPTTTAGRIWQGHVIYGEAWHGGWADHHRKSYMFPSESGLQLSGGPHSICSCTCNQNEMSWALAVRPTTAPSPVPETDWAVTKTLQTHWGFIRSIPLK